MDLRLFRFFRLIRRDRMWRAKLHIQSTRIVRVPNSRASKTGISRSPEVVRAELDEGESREAGILRIRTPASSRASQERRPKNGVPRTASRALERQHELIRRRQGWCLPVPFPTVGPPRCGPLLLLVRYFSLFAGLSSRSSSPACPTRLR
jgi:hypothetical protein